MAAVEFIAMAAGFGALVLALTARLTGRALLVGLLFGMVPAVLLWLLASEGSALRSMAIPMASGASLVALIRSVKGPGVATSPLPRWLGAGMPAHAAYCGIKFGLDVGRSIE